MPPLAARMQHVVERGPGTAAPSGHVGARNLLGRVVAASSGFGTVVAPSSDRRRASSRRRRRAGRGCSTGTPSSPRRTRRPCRRLPAEHVTTPRPPLVGGRAPRARPRAADLDEPMSWSDSSSGRRTAPPSSLGQRGRRLDRECGGCPASSSARRTSSASARSSAVTRQGYRIVALATPAWNQRVLGACGIAELDREWNHTRDRLDRMSVWSQELSKIWSSFIAIESGCTVDLDCISGVGRPGRRRRLHPRRPPRLARDPERLDQSRRRRRSSSARRPTSRPSLMFWMVDRRTPRLRRRSFSTSARPDRRGAEVGTSPSTPSQRHGGPIVMTEHHDESTIGRCYVMVAEIVARTPTNKGVDDTTPPSSE